MTSRRYLPALLLLFVGSGCAALIYEIVWFQLLQLVIGSSAVSLGVLLGTFMGGMCLGSLLLPRFVSSSHHPLRVYAWLETRHRNHRRRRPARNAARVRPLHRMGGHRHRRASCSAAWRPGSACCRRRCSWARRCRLWRVGSQRLLMACRGSGSSTAATPAAPSSAASSPGSTSCACTTRPSRPSSLSA